MSNPSSTTPSLEAGGDALKTFQLTTDSISDKSSEAYGLAISKYITSTVNAGLGGYYYARNARFLKNRNWANGRINVQAMFQDRFHFDGKDNYIQLHWNTLQIVNRIVSGLVGRWMARGEKIQVKAIDDLSQKNKKDEYDQIEFILDNRAKLEALQQESGEQIIPEDQFIPADKEELKLWQAQFQRIPEEILYELGCNDVLGSNGWFDVLKEKMLHDAAEVLFVGTYTWMDKEGVIHVEWVKPENAIYSYSDYPDFRNTSWRGQVPDIKISELRKRYGKEFGGKLTEEQIWEIAQKTKNYTQYSNLNWSDLWQTSFMRPYDEWNIKAIDFELKTVDNEPYTVTKTKNTGSTYTQKGYPSTPSGKKRAKPSENQKVYEDTNWNIYRGVYLPDCEILLEWGLKDNMIRPQDPKEIGNAEFSYSYVMPQNFLMRNLAIPEKIEAAVEGMILALLKMQQVVARMRPTGAAIDESALENIDYGLGEAGNKNVDKKKLYDQTGDIYYRSIGPNDERIPIPIQELANSGFLGQMDGLIKLYQFHYQTLKDELGEDPNLISAALQPRVTAGNVEASQSMAEYATDYVYRAYSECMKITARKVSCLLKDSVTYGAAAYRNISKEEIAERQFSTDIRFMPTQEDTMKFEAMMNQAIASNPDLVLFINPFELMEMAKEDTKLAWLLFNNGRKKMLLHQQQVAQQNQQQVIQGQIDSAKSAEEEKRKTKEMEMEVESHKTKVTGQAQNQTAVVNMVSALLKPSAEGVMPTIPPQLKPVVDAVLQNIIVGAIASTEQQKQDIIAQMQQAQEEQQQQEQMAQQQMQQGQIQQQSQPQVAA